MTKQKSFITEIAGVYSKAQATARLTESQHDFDEKEMVDLLVEALTEASIKAKSVRVPEGWLLQLEHPKTGTVVDLRIDLVYPF